MNAIERQESTLLFERIGGLRIKHILIWLITSVISVVILFPLTNRTGTIGPTGNIIYAVNLTAVSIIRPPIVGVVARSFINSFSAAWWNSGLSPIFFLMSQRIIFGPASSAMNKPVRAAMMQRNITSWYA